MAIAVTKHSDFEDEVYPTGTSWVIDRENQLHVVGADGNLASYSRGFWQSVKHVTLAVASNGRDV